MTTPSIDLTSPPVDATVRSILAYAAFGDGDGYCDRAGTSQTRSIGILLREYAKTPARLGSQDLPPPNPAVDAALRARPEQKRRRPNGMPVERTAWNALGTSHDTVRQHWRELRDRHGRLAAPDGPWLMHFVPVELWLVVLSVVADGPAIYGDRVQTIMKVARDGSASRAELGWLRTAAGRLAAAVALHAELGERHPLGGSMGLSAWTQKRPEFARVRSQVRQRAKGPAPRHRVRLHYAGFTGQIVDKLRCEAVGIDEHQALRQLSTDDLIHGGLFRLVRDRAIWTVLTVGAPRILATLKWFDQGHVVERYEHLGGISPAILLQPYKTAAGDDFHNIPIPHDAWFNIGSYRLFVQRYFHEVLDRELHEHDPFFFGELRPRDKSGALLPPSRYSVVGLSSCLAKLSLNAHGFRKLTKQFLADGLAARVIAQLGYPDEATPERRDVIGEALACRDFSNMPALYRGDTTPEGKERLSWLGANVCWEMLTTSLGARRDPDEPAFRQAVRATRDLPEQLDAVEREFDRLCDAIDGGRNVKGSALQRNSRLILRVASELKTAEAHVESALRGDPDTMVIIGDDVDESGRSRCNLRLVMEEELNGASSLPQRRRLKRVRTWVTPNEASDVLGPKPSTMRSYISNGLPPSKRFWDHDQPPIMHFNETHRAIYVDGLHRSALTQDQVLALAQLLSQDPPPGWPYPGMQPDPRGKLRLN